MVSAYEKRKRWGMGRTVTIPRVGVKHQHRHARPPHWTPRDPPAGPPAPPPAPPVGRRGPAVRRKSRRSVRRRAQGAAASRQRRAEGGRPRPRAGPPGSSRPLGGRLRLSVPPPVFPTNFSDRTTFPQFSHTFRHAFCMRSPFSSFQTPGVGVFHQVEPVSRPFFSLTD